VGTIDDSRAAWGASKNSNPRRITPSARKGISWHYDGGHPLNLAGQPHSACLDRVRADQAFHKNTRGWADIGYNLLVCQHGRVIEGRGVDLQGAHSPGVNDTHYGVQFMVGGAEAPTPAAWSRAAELAAQLAAHSGRTLRQWGHKDDPKASTECPGSVIEAWAKRLASGGAPIITTPTPQEDEDMPLTDTDVERIADRTAAKVLWAPTWPNAKGPQGSSIRNNVGLTLGTAQQVLGIVRQLAKRAQVDVDEQALAGAIVAGMGPTIQAAVAELFAQAVPAEQFADELLAKLGAALVATDAPEAVAP
jgi:hypothetical protein